MRRIEWVGHNDLIGAVQTRAQILRRHGRTGRGDHFAYRAALLNVHIHIMLYLLILHHALKEYRAGGQIPVVQSEMQIFCTAGHLRL